MSEVKIISRYGLHTSGTKFYHVVTFATDTKSFAIRHYGKAETFIDLGTVSLGTMEEDTAVINGANAGKAKFQQKSTKDGYSDNITTHQWTGTFDEALDKVQERIGPKLRSLVLRYLKSPEFKGSIVSDVPILKKPKEPDERPDQKHSDWGSW